MEKIKLPHRFVLMHYLQAGKDKMIAGPALQKLTTLAAIAEAYLFEKIALKDGEVSVKDSKKTGHSIIDDIIEEIESADQPQSLSDWTMELSDKLQTYQHVSDNLLVNKLLAHTRKKILGVFPTGQTVALFDKNIQRNIRDYLINLSQKQNLNLRDFLTLYLVSHHNLFKKADNNIHTTEIIQRMKAKPVFALFAGIIDKIINKDFYIREKGGVVGI